MAVRLVMIIAALCLATALIGCNRQSANPPPTRLAQPAYAGAAKGARQGAQEPRKLYLRGSKHESETRQRTSNRENRGGDPSPYRLDSGDRLRVVVFGQENLSRIYSVDGSGQISMPLIGAVRARGATTFELEDRIASQLREKYVKDPKVTVEVQTYRPFFILGEVRQPGQFPYVNGMTVQTAVAIAGGYTERARESRAKLTRRRQGRSVTMEVPGNYRVRPGDTIYVEERLF